jgi:hypothetical protein
VLIARIPFSGLSGVALLSVGRRRCQVPGVTSGASAASAF